MMKFLKLMSLTMITFFLMLGCSAGGNIHKYSQSQLSAMTTRTVLASHVETYRAATDAMFDVGFTIEESDRDGGILTGSRADDRTAERFWVNPYMKDTQYKMTVLVRDINSKESTVRLSMSRNGEAFVEESVIDEFWRKMKRQVLLKETIPAPSS
jgi:hypothetical protein